MKIKASLEKHFFLLVVLIFASFGGGCSSQKIPPPFDEASLQSNPYFVFYQKQTPDFQKLLMRSSFSLLRGTNGIFLENLSAPKTAQGFFKSMSHPLIHGDFHADQMAKIDSINTLEDLDTADFAPFWIDLVRQESSAMVLSVELSLKTYTPGACSQSYIDTLKNRAPRLTLTGSPYFGELSQPPATAEKTATPFVPAPWTTGVSLKNDDPMKTLLEKEWAKLFPEKKLKEFKKIKTGVGSFLSTNYMGQSEDNLYIEFKELDSAPLKSFKAASKAGAMKPCERYLLAGKIYKPAFKLQCVDIETKSFMVNPYREAYLPPRLSKISRVEDLTQHQIWMCVEIAKAHQKTWTPSDIRILLRAWDSNPLLGERILMQAQSQAELIVSAYRMILHSQKE